MALVAVVLLEAAIVPVVLVLVVVVVSVVAVVSVAAVAPVAVVLVLVQALGHQAEHCPFQVEVFAESFDRPEVLPLAIVATQLPVVHQHSPISSYGVLALSLQKH